MRSKTRVGQKKEDNLKNEDDEHNEHGPQNAETNNEDSPDIEVDHKKKYDHEKLR